MKKLIAAIVVFAILATPAQAWYRGYGYGGWGYRPYYGGYGYGPGWGGYGAAVGIGAGAALLGGVIGGAIASQQRYYGPAQCPVYDAWGNPIGYTYC